MVALNPTLDKGYAELDPVFSVNIDEDYDYTISGITRKSFCHVYLSWIQYCVSRKEKVSIYFFDLIARIELERHFTSS